MGSGAEPLDGLGSEALHLGVRDLSIPGVHPAADEALVHDDVGVEDLTGLGMDAAGTDRETHVRVGPADEVVPSVLGILVHVGLGGRILLVDDDGVVETDFLKRVVPLQDGVADPAAVADRNRVLDVEHDRLLRRADLQLGIGLLQMPAIDVSLPGGVGTRISDVLHTRREVADSIVGESRLVRAAGRNLRDRVVELRELRGSPAGGHLEAELHVSGERLGLHDLHQSGVRTGRGPPEEGTCTLHEERVQIDHGAAAGSHRHDGHLGDHPVGEDAVRRILALLVSGGDRRVVGFDESEPLSESLPLRVLVTDLDGGHRRTAGDRPREEEFLLLEVARQLGDDLLRLVVSPQAVEAACPLGGRYLDESLRDLVEGGKLLLPARGRSRRALHGHRRKIDQTGCESSDRRQEKCSNESHNHDAPGILKIAQLRAEPMSPSESGAISQRSERIGHFRDEDLLTGPLTLQIAYFQ